MKMQLYQTEWFGIDLKNIQSDLKHSPSEVADSEIYLAVYKKLFSSAKPMSAEWLKRKSTISKWLENYLSDKKNKNILSIGCGLGIIEVPLIKTGFKIDLQECQDVSIQYMQKNAPNEFKKSKFITSTDLKNIDDDSYDVVIAFSCTYCLPDDVLIQFLQSVKRILKKDGVFIWYETVLSMNDVVENIKRILIRAPYTGILWGWKRLSQTLIKQAKKQDLALVDFYSFASDNTVVNPKKILGLPLGNNVAWQMMVLKKND